MKNSALILILILLASCAATQVNNEASHVRITREEPKKCIYLGDITGGQGDFLTGGYTSNENLEIGARNDLKNKAFKMGADTVYLLTQRAGSTFSDKGGSQTNVVLSGSAFDCSATEQGVRFRFENSCFRLGDADACWGATWRLAKIKKNNEALRYFEQCLVNGWTDWDYINKDTDIASLRKTKKFQKLMKKYQTKTN